MSVSAWGAVPEPPPQSRDPVKGLGFDKYGNLYVTGYFQGEVDFDPDGSSDIHLSNGDWDAYITKFNVYGEHQWTYTWGGANTDRGQDIVVSNLNRIFVTDPTTCRFSTAHVSKRTEPGLVRRSSSSSEGGSRHPGLP